jgi:hypothetical protein
MSSNNRILYSCQAAAITNIGVPSLIGSGTRDDPSRNPVELSKNIVHSNKNYGEVIHGLQSVGITTNFNLEQVFELGQIEIYENIEGIPDVEVTLEKNIDGYPLMYHMASTGVTSTSASGLLARSKQQCDVRLGIFGEEFDNVGGATVNGGDAEVEVYMSGMYISSVGYTFPVDGGFSESVTLVGNNKEWLTGSNTEITDLAVTDFDGNDSPLALAAGSGGVQRREDLLMEYSILPVGIDGVNGTGVGNAYKWSSAFVIDQDPSLLVHTGIVAFKNSGLAVHVQNVSINTDFSREDVFELGKKNPYYRPATFPVEVTCEIEAVTTSGDFITALEDGDPALNPTSASGNNTQEENIHFVLRGGYSFDLGKKNRLSSVSYGGGDATGGNVSCSYSYTNFNDLDVKYIYHNHSGVMGFDNSPLNFWFDGTTE